MKKLLKIMGVVAVCATFAVVAYNQVNAKPENPILAKNIEALTYSENGNGSSGSCGSYGWTGDSYAIVCNVTKERALENFNWWSTPYKGWCCESCSTTWYCGDNK